MERQERIKIIAVEMAKHYLLALCPVGVPCEQDAIDVAGDEAFLSDAEALLVRLEST